MAEFIDYKVALFFKDGSETHGIVTLVDEKLISLGSRVFENGSVKDLKVIQLPLEGKKRKSTNKTGSLDELNKASGSSTSKNASKFEDKNLEWSSDVQEIKGSEDFDFAANLAMFDKKSVFADFQKNDNVSAHDRLVTHNKLEKKSKKVQDKFENDEMILPQDKQDSWNSIGSLSQRLLLPVPASGIQSNASYVNREAQKFRFMFDDGNTTVPVASPVQLLEIERICEEKFGLDSRVSAEVCALNLFKLVVSRILGGSVRLSNRKNHNLPPLVLLLIGGGHCSSKAFALGRHLSNHGVRVLAYVIDEEMIEADTLQQCHLFEKCGGKVLSASFVDLLHILNNQLETPVELVIDSLQGFSGQLPDLFLTARSMEKLKQVIRWTNDSTRKFQVMSLDISAGVDGGSGTVSDVLLQVRSNYIASLGIPISGLLHAHNNGHLTQDIQHYVIDTGFCNDVFSVKPQLRKFDKFWFCAEGLLKLELTAD